MSQTLFRIAILLIAAACSSCAYVTYQKLQVGKFEGSLDVRWIKPDRFIYIPNKDNPLRFTTSAKRTIQPRAIYTDGGSIPRLFWGLPGYSPWAYAPSYIIHDWLFEAHRCALPEYHDISFDDSARILAEGIKTLMESGIAPRDEIVLWSIYEAVKSPTARSLWDRSNGCRPQPEALSSDESPGELIFRIDIDALFKK